MEKACFTAKEASEYLGVCLTIVQRQLRAGILPHKKIGRRYIIPKASLDRWLEQEPEKDYAMNIRS